MNKRIRKKLAQREFDFRGLIVHALRIPPAGETGAEFDHIWDRIVVGCEAQGWTIGGLISPSEINIIVESEPRNACALTGQPRKARRDLGHIDTHNLDVLFEANGYLRTSLRSYPGSQLGRRWNDVFVVDELGGTFLR